MPPPKKEDEKKKKKKLTKKEKAALKAAELERLAEEQRVAEAAEAERLEQERQRLAEEARIAAEIAAKVATELEERKIIEDKENAPLFDELKSKLADEERKREYETESEAAVNAYITEWEEAPRQELEPALAECERTAALLLQLDEAQSLALRKPAASRGAAALWYPAALAALGRMTIEKLDAVTADILANADERATSRNELQLCAQAEWHKFALWVNLARNPRVRSVELAEVAVSFELPKALALASVAIRVVQFRAEHAMPSFGVPSPYQTVGGVFLLELLQLPPVPKRVKGWTLRQVGPSAHTVTRMAYPLPQLGSEPSAGAAAPLRLSVVLPADVVVPELVRVGWWDEPNAQWALEGISDIRYEPETRQLSLQTVHLRGLAVLQPTHAELPYSRWALKPTARSRSVLAVQSAHYRAVFDVSAEGVLLLEPQLPQLSSLLGVRMPSAILLGRLREAGINLSPHDRDATPLEAALTVKSAELEEEALREVLLLSATFRLTDSKWNASRPAHKVCVRVGTNLPPDEDDGLMPSTEPKVVDYFAGRSEDGWQTLLYSHRYAAVIHSGETDAQIALDVHGMEQLAKGEVAHGTAVSCFKQKHPELTLDLASSSAHYMSVLQQLFMQLRLLSFTTGGT